MAETKNVQLQISGLTRAEALEIQGDVGGDSVTIAKREGEADEHRDLGATTILLASIAPSLIRIVGELIDRRRKARKAASTIVIAKIVNGKSQRFTIELPGKEGEKGTSPTVLSELAKILEISVKELQKA